MSRLREGENMNQPDAQTAPNYVTCPCQYCSGKIEFDANQLDPTGSARGMVTGQTVSCPHCGLETISYMLFTKVAKRLDCGAFIAAFIRGWTLDVKQS
jgi:DNA-directed RNA polymerase subunit RPC12/RpoP